MEYSEGQFCTIEVGGIIEDATDINVVNNVGEDLADWRMTKGTQIEKDKVDQMTMIQNIDGGFNKV